MMQVTLSEPPKPEIHAAAAGAGSSIIGILEVIESDMANNLVAVNSQEEESQAEYDTMTHKNQVTITLKNQDVKYKTSSYVTLDKNIAEHNADRSSVNSELSSVNDYYASMKARCTATPESYASRKERRAAEIRGLKEALQILQDDTAFTQRRKRGMQRRFLGF